MSLFKVSMEHSGREVQKAVGKLSILIPCALE